MFKRFNLFERCNIVKQIPLFSELGWVQANRVALKSTLHEFKKGETIIKEGSPSASFFCLVSGRVQSFREDSHGRKTEVKFVRRGEPFGLTALLADDKHMHGFSAVNDSLILCIEKVDFKKLLNLIPSLGVDLSHSLSRKVRANLDGLPRVSGGQIISVYCPVKGCGASTYAAHLALGLQWETHKKVVLVHLSSRSSRAAEESAPANGITVAPHWAQPDCHLSQLIKHDEKIQEAVCRDAWPIDLLNVAFDTEDSSLVDEISQFVTALVANYHFVVVDLPNEMDEIVLKTLTQSDTVQLVIRDDPSELEAGRQVIYELEESLKENFEADKVQVIVRAGPWGEELSYEQINRAIDFDVYTKLPDVQADDMMKMLISPVVSMPLLDASSVYAQIVRKRSRELGDVLVGLVLGGGAALGICHIGILRVLERERIPVDVVAGSSMGALIGSFWVTGHHADQIERLARQFESRKGLFKLLDPVVPISGFIGGQAIKRWLRKHLGGKIFYDTTIPFKVVAYDIIKRQEIVLNSGPLVDAVAQSIAIPGVINPIRDHDKVIIDGGVLNPLPVNVLKNLGIKKVIAVNVLQSPEDVTAGFLAEQEALSKEAKIAFGCNPFKYLGVRIKKRMDKMFMPNISDIIVRSLQASEYLIAEQSGKDANVLIHPDLVGLNWYELYRVEELIKRGEDAAEKHLNAIRRLVEE